MRTFAVDTLLSWGIILAQLTDGLPVDPPQPVPPTATRSGLIRSPQNGTAPSCTSIDTPVLTRNAMINRKYRWTTFNVHPDVAYNAQEYQMINDVTFHLSQMIPCVRFGIFPPTGTPAPHGDYVRIIKGTNNGCNSQVGRMGGRQDMNLQVECVADYGTVMHEMLHALGLQHEHQRPDRDDYINIHWDNVQPELRHAFDKSSTSEVTTFGVPYNIRSLMHYNNYAFSRNGQQTMSSRTGEPLGSIFLQETDIRKLKLMYNC